MTLWKIGTSTLIQARLPAHHSLKTAAITHNAVRPAPRLTFPRLPQAHITRHEVLKSSVRATHIIFMLTQTPDVMTVVQLGITSEDLMAVRDGWYIWKAEGFAAVCRLVRKECGTPAC